MFRAYAQISPTETQFIDEAYDLATLVEQVVGQLNMLVTINQPILFWLDEQYSGCLTKDKDGKAIFAWPQGHNRFYQLKNGKFERVRE